ncbi:phosphatidylinositol N-acetylglucosaminyltransferase [Rhodotorula toruloides]|uniref:Phosphatidylinositol N-acetylglucosaminyltransferase n=1 Tax=Rhodotorula toruloides TaxID=5286 RepID=A0A511KQD3_RHOTO|nr:phosphatidylinositol N-acetylglucosaminyltransferase [Rhodotorula toruloides]
MASYTLRQTHGDTVNACYTAATAPSLPLSRILLLASLALTAAALDNRRWTTSASAVLLSLAFCVRSSREETLEIFPSLGLQLASRSGYHFSLPSVFSKPLTFGSSRKTHLIPLECIAKVVVNEALQGAAGRHYLAVVEKGARQADEAGRRVFVVFPSVLPRLADLQPVWKDTQRLLAPK